MLCLFLYISLIFVSSVHCEICSVCSCAFVDVTPAEPEPLENVEIIAFKYKMESVEAFDSNRTYGPVQKYFYVDCSGDSSVGQINNLDWPHLSVLGTLANFKRSKWKKLEFFPDHVKKQMKVLSISDNFIVEIEPTELDEFENLKMLNLSGNQIKFLGKSIFGKLGSLTILDLSGNLLSNVDDWAFYGTNLKYLNMSKNSLSNLNSNIFRGLNNLKVLDLSENNINILPNDFHNCLPALATLLLSHNLFNKVPEMPKNLKKLTLKKNKLNELKLSHANLEVLDVSHNEITSLAETNLPLLKVIKASHNNLTQLLSLKSHGLATIDISYNHFNTVPNDINPTQFYYLQKLYLDGNPVKILNFSHHLEPFRHLKTLSFTHCSIENIGKNSLDRLVPSNGEYCSTDKGVTLNFSHNLIKFIDEDVFTKLTGICSLDLGHNNLKTLTEHVLPWHNISHVNLQGNPWNCDCKIQWMLDDFMVFMYKNHPYLLLDLRCASPSKYNQKMFVSWYNKSENVFCKSTPSIYYVNLIGGKTLEIWTASAIACVILACFIVLMIVLIIILLFTKPSRKRKRRGTKVGGSTVYRPIQQNVRGSKPSSEMQL